MIGEKLLLIIILSILFCLIQISSVDIKADEKTVQ